MEKSAQRDANTARWL